MNGTSRSVRPPTAPALRSAGSVLAVAFLVHALTASAPYGLPALLPFVRQALGGSYLDAALVSSAFLVGIVIGSPAAGSAVDAFGVRRAMLGGGVLATAMLAMIPGTSSVLAACLLLATAGVGYSVLTPGTNKAMLAWFRPQRRATAVGIKQTGVSAGGMAAASFVPIVSLGWAWQASFHLIALCFAIAVVLTWITEMDGPAHRVARGAPQPMLAALRVAIGTRSTLLLSLDAFLRVGIQYAFLTYLVAYSIDRLHAPVAWSVALYAAAHAFGAIGRVGWGWFSDRVCRGRRRGPYASIALTAAAGFLLLAYAAPLGSAWLIASVALLGISAAGFQGVGLSLLAEVGGARVGAISGIVNSLAFLGAAVMVPVCGALLDAGASFATLFASLAALCVVAGGIALSVHEEFDAGPHAR
jgi:MFS family permease